MGKVSQYEKKLAASITTIEFMGTLLPRYTARDMSRMWNALAIMVKRYGIIFVADEITRNKAETELALQEVAG